MVQQVHSGECQLILYSLGTGVEKLRRFGVYGYSYGFLRATFLDMLRGYAALREIVRPESQLEFAVAAAKENDKSPLIFGFVPFQDLYPTKSAPSVIYMCWEFPDTPDASLNNNPRFDWLRLSQHVALVVVPTQFVKDVLQAAGVRVPIHVVPVPMPRRLLDLPLWEAGQAVTINCRAIILDAKMKDVEAAAASAVAVRSETRRALKWLGKRCTESIRHAVPPRFREIVTRRVKKWRVGRIAAKTKNQFPIAPVKDEAGSITLDGVVYTMIFNPLDDRKNWQDLVTAFVSALRNMPDATLVLKMSVLEQFTPNAIAAASALYRKLEGITHLCRVVVIAEPLPEPQMALLFRATTYYANITRAEGACLPLQEALASGRPALSPTHTAMGDYFDDDVGFVVEMNPEPTHWPGDTTGKMSTRWARLNWQSLHDQCSASYKLAQDASAYHALATAARQRMCEYADPDIIREKLYDALDSVGMALAEAAPLIAKENAP